jgi:UTP--glucose-1-phosphate uridylyltransferase
MAHDITAVIPLAGAGRRMMPATRVLPKALFPLVSPDGAVRPVADWIVRHALTACRRACLVCSAGQDELLARYFAGEADLKGRIDYVAGVEPYGFGYAVWAAWRRAGIAGGNVMVLLGDHIHLAAPGAPTPAQQVAAAFARQQCSAVVGVQVVDQSQLGLVGVCRGEPAGFSDFLEKGLYRCTRLVEKPDAATARAELVTPGLPSGKYLAHAGIYVFTPEVFECLDSLVAARREKLSRDAKDAEDEDLLKKKRLLLSSASPASLPASGAVCSGREIGLTDAQQMLLQRRRPYFLRLIEGTTHDTGTPEGYVRTQAAMLRGDTGFQPVSADGQRTG